MHITDVAFVYIRHHPHVFQSGDDEHLIVLVGTYLHLLIDILFDDETRYRRFHYIKGFAGKVVDGEYFRDSLLFRFGIAQFLACLQHIAFRCHAGCEHILHGLQVAPGDDELLFGFFFLFLIIGYLTAPDDGKYIAFAYMVADFGRNLGHRSPEDGEYACHLFLIESDPAVKRQLIGHFMYVYGVHRYYVL